MGNDKNREEILEDLLPILMVIGGTLCVLVGIFTVSRTLGIISTGLTCIYVGSECI